MSGHSGCAAPMRATFAKLKQEIVWRHKEGILLKDTADDDHRMDPHDIDDIEASFRRDNGRWGLG